MTPTETLILVAYFFVLSILAIYGWHRYYLVYLYMKHKDNVPPGAAAARTPLPRGHGPAADLQRDVRRRPADRRRSARIDYPRELLEIQVLDDSTDETREIAELAVRRHAGAGLRHQVPPPHRPHRLQGRRARGRPEGRRAASSSRSSTPTSCRRPTSCTRTLPHFTDPKVAMVQARWGHINQDYSLLTKIQAILLDGHFVLEHGGRNRAGCFFNFNGTAGIWRREAIADAGGWQHDTLTEDLDLSYRAQLRGWQFVFLPDLVAPAEVPVEMNAFKSQQHRWAKGSIQTCCKLLPRILRSDLPLDGQGRGVLPPDGELQLPADVAAVDPDVPGDGRPLQHGLVPRCCSSTCRCSSRRRCRSATSTWSASASCTRTGRRG